MLFLTLLYISATLVPVAISTLTSFVKLFIDSDLVLSFSVPLPPVGAETVALV